MASTSLTLSPTPASGKRRLRHAGQEPRHGAGVHCTAVEPMERRRRRPRCSVRAASAGVQRLPFHANGKTVCRIGIKASATQWVWKRPDARSATTDV